VPAPDPGAARERRALAWLWLIAALSAIALRPFWLALAGTAPVCAWHRLTGLPCLTCGGTRAAVAFLHGELPTAFAWNPLVTLAGLLFLVGGLAAPLWARRGGPLPRIPNPLPRSWRLAVLALVGANWLYLVLHRV